MCAERGVKEAYTNNTTHKCLIVDHSFDARKLKSQNWKHVEVAVCRPYIFGLMMLFLHQLGQRLHYLSMAVGNVLNGLCGCSMYKAAQTTLIQLYII